jgi:aerobic carbon-monoxide dehydrogenase large subunit
MSCICLLPRASPDPVAAGIASGQCVLGLVTLDLDPLPTVLDPEAALRRDATVIHDRFETNLIGGFTVGKGDTAGPLARAPRRLQRRFYHHRYAAMPMECRGVVGLHDSRTDSVTIWSGKRAH